jgi:hypothetical protein
MKKVVLAVIIVIGFALSISNVSTPAFAGKQPKWQEFMRAYSKAVRTMKGEPKALDRLAVIKARVSEARLSSGTTRKEFYAIVAKGKNEVKAICSC